jgi:hypothetical protein
MSDITEETIIYNEPSNETSNEPSNKLSNELSNEPSNEFSDTMIIKDLEEID